MPGGYIALRDSKDPTAGHFTSTRAEMAAWIRGVEAGGFDDLA